MTTMAIVDTVIAASITIGIPDVVGATMIEADVTADITASATVTAGTITTTIVAGTEGTRAANGRACYVARPTLTPLHVMIDLEIDGSVGFPPIALGRSRPNLRLRVVAHPTGCHDLRFHGAPKAASRANAPMTASITAIVRIAGLARNLDGNKIRPLAAIKRSPKYNTALVPPKHIHKVKVGTIADANDQKHRQSVSSRGVKRSAGHFFADVIVGASNNGQHWHPRTFGRRPRRSAACMTSGI